MCHSVRVENATETLIIVQQYHREELLPSHKSRQLYLGYYLDVFALC